MPDLKPVNPGQPVSAAAENAQTEEIRRLRAIVDRVEGSSGGIVRLGYIVSRTRSVPTRGDQVGYVVGFWGRPDRAPVTVPPERVAGRFLAADSPAPLTPFAEGQLVKLKVWPAMAGEDEVVFIDEGERYIGQPCVPPGGA